MFNKNHPPVGARPGTLMISSESPATKVECVRFGTEVFETGELSSIEDLPECDGSSEMLWIDVQGFGTESWLLDISRQFNVHPLALEDLVNVPQVPKSEDYGDQQLMIVKVATVDQENQIQISQIGMILARGFVLTFRPEASSLLQPVHERLRMPTSRLRQNKTDYLAYVILDTAVDTYYQAIGAIVDAVDDLENRTLADPNPDLIFEINDMKNRLSELRRSLWPQRETFQSLIRGDCELISEPVRMFLRDTSDHCIQATDVVEMYRDRSSGLMNTYLSAVAHRTNEIMKFLTVISSIFVPLTFIAGIYGMNFPHMPEFQWSGAYYIFWVLTIGIASAMGWFFIRSGWIRPRFLRAEGTATRRHKTLKRASTLVRLESDRKLNRSPEMPGPAAERAA